MRHKSLKLTIAAVIAFLAGLLSTVRAQDQSNERFDLKVRNDFFAGFSGNSEALARGMKACEDALAKNPKNAEALVWHGGGLLSLAASAFQSGDQQKGMELWGRGLGEMKTAVGLEPDSVGVRIPRGATLLSSSHFVPPQMAKGLIEDGVADYQRTYDLQKSYFATLGTHPRGELLFGLAEGYSRLGDQEKAQQYFEQIRRELPNTAYAKRADLWFETKSIPADQTGCVGCHVSK
jgi:tetratricopeptide (TPR) repeat protein